MSSELVDSLLASLEEEILRDHPHGLARPPPPHPQTSNGGMYIL